MIGDLAPEQAGSETVLVVQGSLGAGRTCLCRRMYLDDNVVNSEVSMPDYHGWEKLKKLGEGGQGEVWLVRSPERQKAREHARQAVAHGVHNISGIGGDIVNAQFLEAIAEFNRPDAPEELGALKQFNMSSQGPESDRAIKRFANEIEALKKLDGDAAVLRVLASDTTQQWMVTDYHAGGSLSNHLERFKGDVLGSLRALRPIIAALAKLHEQGIVHRDIKTKNILMGRNGLVLADFGIVFLDTEHRATELIERVGTRDWMPPWAHTGMRIEDVRPNFDVFPLGKVLWSMISGRHILPYWYHRRKQNNLTQIFPKQPEMYLANVILDRCVVEHESHCLSSAGELLRMADVFLVLLSRGGQLLGKGVPRPCSVCGVGQYQIQSGRFPLPGSPDWDVYACDYCDHIQFFGKSKPFAEDPSVANPPPMPGQD